MTDRLTIISRKKIGNHQDANHLFIASVELPSSKNFTWAVMTKIQMEVHQTSSRCLVHLPADMGEVSPRINISAGGYLLVRT